MSDGAATKLEPHTDQDRCPYTRRLAIQLIVYFQYTDDDWLDW